MIVRPPITEILWVAAVGLAACALSTVASGLVLRFLKRKNIFDLPNERSSHDTPTPRGGGLGVMFSLYTVWGAVAWSGIHDSETLWAVLACGVPLVALGWLDDVHTVPAIWRLVCQVAVVSLLLGVARPLAGPVWQGLLPPFWGTVATALAWVWFINLYNFMDGIDGITGTQTACLGVGTCLVVAATRLGTDLMLLSIALAGVGLGFLYWNRAPARLFLGDVGSVPLGFMAGWLLLELAARGLWAPALILPLYYLADATITLTKRVLRGNAPWRAHREHFYQLALRHGFTHSAVVGAILVTNLILIGIALMSTTAPNPFLTVLGAGVPVAFLLVWLVRRRGTA